MPQDQKTALLTAAGSASAMTLLNSLRAMNMNVVACDLYPREWNEASMAADAFFQAESAMDAERYTARLLIAVQRYGLDYILPLTDVEVDALCAKKPLFEARGCTLCVPDAKSASLCRDKARMAEALHSANICRTIPTFSPYGYVPDASEFPLMLKPSHGRSSQGLVRVENTAAYQAALKARADYIAQPYLDGDILTVDTARDAFGHTRTLARRELLRTVNGLGTTVRTLPEHLLNATATAIAKFAGIVGVVNMEFIEHKGEYWFLEVNPRFSGGAGFSALAGMDLAKLAILCCSGQPLPELPPFKEALMTRAIAPIITKE